MSGELERRPVFPFPAIVGQEKAKLALLAVAVNPSIGGVLLRGDKGTGKTTMVRALADVLPEVKVVADCPFRCDPDDPRYMCDRCYEKFRRGEELPIKYVKMRVVDLPLSITIERLVGTINIEKFLREGVVEFKPGILAEANRNILYIDEVNLLDDYIIDTLLDVAASGWNIVEREGISVRHPARFILVGSMNPEEGELRPQILDRFGLVVNVEAPMDPEVRAEIARRVEEWQQDPISFYKKYLPEIQKLREQIARARELLPKVEIDDDLLKFLAKTIVELGIKTSRAEIVTVRTAKAIAALNGRIRVTLEDLKKAMELALPHRLKAKPFQSENPFRQDRADTTTEDVKKRQEELSTYHNMQMSSAHSGDRGQSSKNVDSADSEASRQQVVPPATGKLIQESVQLLEAHELSKHCPEVRSRRARSRIFESRLPGLTLYAVQPRDVNYVSNIDIYETVKFHVLTRGLTLPILPEEIRVPVKSCRVPCLDVLVLDLSGSMNFQKRIAVAKQVIRQLASKSYIERTFIALVGVQGREGKVIVDYCKNYELVYNIVLTLPSGGSTPLAHGLYLAYTIAKRWLSKYRSGKVVVHVVTDGKANVRLWSDPLQDCLNVLELLRKLKCRIVLYDTRPPMLISPTRTIFDLEIPDVEIVKIS